MNDQICPDDLQPSESDNDQTAPINIVASPPMQRRGWRGLGKFIADHNPFFLLSGVSMLLGCFLINSAAHEQKDRVDLIVGLLGVFNVYELLVIALGLFLARGRGLVRDGAYLLLLEVLLLSDLTFLYTEVFTASATIGLVAATLGFVLAGIKLMAIFHVLRVRLAVRAWAVLAATFFMLFAMPGVLRHFGEADTVTPLLLHVGWWMAGGLLAVMMLPRRGMVSTDSPAMQRLAMAIRVAVSVVPWISIIAHLASAHYVYKTAFLPGNLAPLMLGGAVLLVRSGLHVRHVVAVRMAIVAMCAGGIALTLPYSQELYVSMTWPIPWMLSPFRVAAASSCVIALGSVMLMHGWVLPALAIVSGCSVVFGHDGVTIRRSCEELALLLRVWAKDAAPDTNLEWGVVGVLAAFIFLAIGTTLSLRRPPTNGDGNGHRNTDQRDEDAGPHPAGRGETATTG